MDQKAQEESGRETFGRTWQFADCVFDDPRLELRVAGELVELELKPLEVLLQLLMNEGKVVSKEALFNAVWPGLSVVEGSLTTAVSKLRKALGDAQSTIVVTVPRVGYRMGVVVSSRSAAVPSPITEPALKPGDLVPGHEPWRLVRMLGEPQSKEVWLAENSKTGEFRVFKFAFLARRLRGLKREVTVARYLHESVRDRADRVRLLEWNFETRPFWIGSEYGGENLAEWATSQGGLRNIPVEVRLKLLADVATAVAAAHEAGVLHRDLKPANILVKAGEHGGWQIKVADFGSAFLAEPERLQALGITNLGMTQTGRVQSAELTGTLLYLAPEVLSGNAPTAASDVYALGVMLFQLAAGDFHKPLSVGWEASVEDPLIREDIEVAACGDPAQRLKNPAELAVRISQLSVRRAEREKLELKEQHERVSQRKQAEARVRRPWVIAACVAVLLGLAASWPLYRRVFSSTTTSPKARTVLVLPFQDFSAQKDLNFLQMALADEVSTSLSNMRPLILRPSSSAGRYQGHVDPQKAGRETGANSVVTGHYVHIGEELQITMEAVDVQENRLLWRNTVNVPANSLLSLQAQVAAIARGKLAPALGATTFDRSVSTMQPRNEEAYNLFLRGSTVPAAGEPNQRGLEMMERSVAIDPTYAPAWFALSQRAYFSSRFGGGGDAMMRRSDEAIQRALALDPDYSQAAGELILHNVERGELVKSYDEALDFSKRHPDDASFHHLLNYVLRYAGHLDEASRQCKMARLLDPQIIWNSCGITMIEFGDYKEAPNFIRMQHDSEWSKAINIEFYMRQNKPDVAVSIGVPVIPHWDSYKMLLACAQHKPEAEIATLVPGAQIDGDPEITYLFAGHLSYCGQTEQALRFLQTAVEANYCAYPAMDIDPMLAKIRGTAKFREIRAAGIACQKNFDARRATTAP